MKHISFKILISCVLLPPVLYSVSLVILENYLRGYYTEAIQQVYLGDTRLLFDGRRHLKDAVQENIDGFLKKNRLLEWGVGLEVVIKTKGNTYLYPAVAENTLTDFADEDPIRVASQNYQLMNQGLDIRVDVNLRHGSPISSGILAFYILTALTVLAIHYRRGLRRLEAETWKSQTEIKRLRDLEQLHRQKLEDLGLQRDTLADNYSMLSQRLESEKRQASQIEEGWIQEIEILESDLKNNLDRQQALESEIDHLRSVIQEFEKNQKKPSKQKERSVDSARKRFNALYKNIEIYDHAINGFVDLPENLKIKGEEIVHKLDGEPDKVPIKRKVFGKKNRKTVFEVNFGHKGRLYFRKTKAQRIEVVAIGTKNNQLRDLEFIDSL